MKKTAHLPKDIFRNSLGVVNPLVLVGLAAAGIIVYLLFTSTFPFNNSKLESTYPKPPANAANTTTGNGAPSGTHYNLNIIGVPKGKTADMTSSQGHRIFVPLEGQCKIKLSLGDFQVLDGNCTEGPAAFQLPNPDPTNSGITTYSVWVRALGKPGGSSTTTPCATDPVSGETYCSTQTMVAMRNKGQSSFSDVSKLLLYLYVDLNADGVVERYPLFDSALQDYYWQYDNNGLKLLQMRFYPVSSNVN